MLVVVDSDGFDGENVFALAYVESSELLERELADQPAPMCLAAKLNRDSDRVISHIVLGVTSEAAENALDDALSEC